MGPYSEMLILLASFLIVAIAAARIAKYFTWVKLPIITGLLLIGILTGPFVLRLIPEKSADQLNFINEISLAFIAFAAGAKLHLKELDSRFRSIQWMTLSQMIFIFVLGTATVLLLAPNISFMQNMDGGTVLAIALLIGTIFVARSPVSAIAVINEMRANGPFTQTAMGVTVLKDVLMIILFTLCFAVSDVLIHEIPFNLWIAVGLLMELSLSFALGYLLGHILKFVMAFRLITGLKSVLILAVGYSVYLFAHLIHTQSQSLLGFDIYIEPLLICMIGSFFVVNYSNYRREFIRIIEEAVPMVYVVFFTLTGASISLDILIKSWDIAILLFGIRLLSIIVSAFIGGNLGGDPPQFNRISWMAYITQAGVALGLVSIVSHKYPAWGAEFSTILIAVILLNLIVGPPLFKWSLLLVGESHLRGEATALAAGQRAIIFGLEGHSLALARQLDEHEWDVKIVTRNSQKAAREYKGVKVEYIRDFSLEEMKRIKADEVEALVLMNEDEENLQVCQLAYEKFGTRDLVVRVQERGFIRRFHELGALIVEPSTAIVSLLDHLVRSPIATSLLLGMDKGQDTVDVEMRNPNLHGTPIRDLRLPDDVLILATKRNDHTLISTGYTRLRIGDVLTVVGSVKSVEKVKFRMEEEPRIAKRKAMAFRRKRRTN